MRRTRMSQGDNRLQVGSLPFIAEINHGLRSSLLPPPVIMLSRAGLILYSKSGRPRGRSPTVKPVTGQRWSHKEESDDRDDTYQI
jgi:hypothetical protein